MRKIRASLLPFQTSTSMRLCGARLDMWGPLISRSIEGLITPYRHT